MRQNYFKTALVVMSTLVSFAFAQQAPSPNPMDDIPDTMPFDIPYGILTQIDSSGNIISSSTFFRG